MPITVLTTSELPGGMAPFTLGGAKVLFHLWQPSTPAPLVEGRLWAFIDFIAPGFSGIEVCRRIALDPVLASARMVMVMDSGEPDYIRRALLAGAHDFIIGRPDRQAVLDRVLPGETAGPAEGLAQVITLGGLTVDSGGFQARWKGKPLAMRPNDFRLLRYFAEHPGRVFTRCQLIAALGKTEDALDERTVDVWVGRLRHVLRDAGAGNMLRTVRKLGYVLDRK